MRTTVAVDDRLLAAAKSRARQRGITLGQLVEEALRRELLSEPARPAGPVIPVFDGGMGPRPGVDLTSNRALHAVLDEGLDLEQLR